MGGSSLLQAVEGLHGVSPELHTVEYTPRRKGFQGDDLQGGAWHGRFHGQVSTPAECCRIKLRRAEVAHLLHKRPAAEDKGKPAASIAQVRPFADAL
jgi:hypothetical protein